jgi:hypothetical protein
MKINPVLSLPIDMNLDVREAIEHLHALIVKLNTEVAELKAKVDSQSEA